MRSAHTVAAVRAAEAEVMAGLPTGALMAQAAGGLAACVLDYLGGGYGRRVLLLVGAGDNGGDTLYAGAHLARRGARVDAVLLAEAVHAEGLAALRASGGRVVSADEVCASSPQTWDVALDGIVGIGGKPGLRAPAAGVVAALAQSPHTPVIAVDLPSGVGVDTGELDGPHVRADLTVTFGTLKPCHLLDPAAEACGPVQLVDIGLDGVLGTPVLEALQPDTVAALIPTPAASGHKYSRGVVGVRAGSATYPGAALLAVAGANCGLAGMVRYVGDASVADLVRAHHPEVVGAGQVQAWTVGSGGGEGAAEALAAALADQVPLVVDADALAHLSGPVGVPAVLTPHAGELARILGRSRDQIEARPLESVREAASQFECTVLLKGRRTLIADADGGPVTVNTTGTPWLGTAGSGDVLAGLIGALLAAGLCPHRAAAVGAWLHGATAARIGPALVASDVATALPATIRHALGAKSAN